MGEGGKGKTFASRKRQTFGGGNTIRHYGCLKGQGEKRSFFVSRKRKAARPFGAQTKKKIGRASLHQGRGQRKIAFPEREEKNKRSPQKREASGTLKKEKDFHFRAGGPVLGEAAKGGSAFRGLRERSILFKIG